MFDAGNLPKKLFANLSARPVKPLNDERGHWSKQLFSRLVLNRIIPISALKTLLPFFYVCSPVAENPLRFLRPRETVARWRKSWSRASENLNESVNLPGSGTVPFLSRSLALGEGQNPHPLLKRNTKIETIYLMRTEAKNKCWSQHQHRKFNVRKYTSVCQKANRL